MVHDFSEINNKKARKCGFLSYPQKKRQRLPADPGIPPNEKDIASIYHI